MRILSIETSCDETGVSVIEASGDLESSTFRILANSISSQIDIHRQYGGVYPNMAKREHGKNLLATLTDALSTAFGDAVHRTDPKSLSSNTILKIKDILEREDELLKHTLDELPKINKPNIDAMAVTSGPGLEPALWVGINFAKALSAIWGLPILPINHMEGHIFSSYISGKEFTISNVKFPLLALLISGGHTELVLSEKGFLYKKIGQTRDDAVGEAFDKVARMLGLSYPGGPEISRLASNGHSAEKFKLPRPMLNTNDFDFSFSGLKTAVLYMVKDKKITERDRADIAKEFEQAVSDVLVKKTLLATARHQAKTLVLGGGVAANTRIRAAITKSFSDNMPDVEIRLPEIKSTTDNAAMIAVAGYIQYLKNGFSKNLNAIKAKGNLSL